MAHLLLSDGTVFRGEAFGSLVDADGEVVFNTGMAGYPESLTDPSYCGQILVFTYPLIGNYGVPSQELNEWGFSKYLESENIHVRGVICAQLSDHFSHHEAKKSLDQWLKEEGIPGITGVDTRMLTKKLREQGVMLGRIVGDDANAINVKIEIEDPNLLNLVAEVSCPDVIRYKPSFDTSIDHASIRPAHPSDSTRATQHDTIIVAYDCGMKRNILRSFLKRGVTVIRVPWDFDLKSADFRYDGVFVSNGPGDPVMCGKTIEQIRWSIERKIPTFGICLGTQLMALAVGGKTYKLTYGHRGVNQPCVELGTGNGEQGMGNREWGTGNGEQGMGNGEQGMGNGEQGTGNGKRCIITSQNHGYAVDEKSLPKDWSVWFTNANDGTVEGIRHESGLFSAVQFHPESCPGPEDANYLFDEFLKVVSSSSP